MIEYGKNAKKTLKECIVNMILIITLNIYRSLCKYVQWVKTKPLNLMIWHLWEYQKHQNLIKKCRKLVIMGTLWIWFSVWSQWNILLFIWLWYYSLKQLSWISGHLSFKQSKYAKIATKKKKKQLVTVHYGSHFYYCHCPYREAVIMNHIASCAHNGTLKQLIWEQLKTNSLGLEMQPWRKPKIICETKYTYIFRKKQYLISKSWVEKMDHLSPHPLLTRIYVWCKPSIWDVFLM